MTRINIMPNLRNMIQINIKLRYDLEGIRKKSGNLIHQIESYPQFGQSCV
jgi:hypothetical protein